MVSMIDQNHVAATPGYILAPMRSITCLVCRKVFQGKGRRQLCSQRCQEIRYEHRYRKYQPIKSTACRACGVVFPVRDGPRCYCSAACKDEHEATRWTEYNNQHREQRRAYDSAYRAAGRRKPYVRDLYPSQQRAILEAKLRAEARRPAQAEARKAKEQQRIDRFHIKEAARQMRAMRWHLYGADLCRGRQGEVARFTKKQLAERNRERSRKIDRMERIALKIYREMGFSAPRRDRRIIYRVLKAELPTLNP